MFNGSTSSGAAAGHPLLTRLRAWWEGADLPRLELPPEDVPALPAPKVQPAPSAPGWVERRIFFTQIVFGEGMLGPFEDALARKMIDPLGLNEKLTVVELGAQVGGFSRWISKHTGCYITAFEPDPELARIGAELSTKAGMAKKARIVCEPADSYSARARTVDAIVSKESLFTYPDKAKLFKAIRKSLKPNAQICFTDYVLAGDATAPEMLLWSMHEPATPHLFTPAEYRAEMEKNQLEVSIQEDITSLYTQAVLGQFATFAGSLKGMPPEDERRVLGLEEGEFWNRRLRVMELGFLRVYRFYARLGSSIG